MADTFNERYTFWQRKTTDEMTDAGGSRCAMAAVNAACLHKLMDEYE